MGNALSYRNLQCVEDVLRTTINIPFFQGVPIVFVGVVAQEFAH